MWESVAVAGCHQVNRSGFEQTRSELDFNKFLFFSIKGIKELTPGPQMMPPQHIMSMPPPSKRNPNVQKPISESE